jgi:hypothetical protein
MGRRAYALAVILCICLLATGMVWAANGPSPADKGHFVAGWAFGNGDGELSINGNPWIAVDPEGLNTTSTGGPTTPTPYEDALQYLSYQTEMEINLDLPATVAEGTYLVRLLFCENWWDDGEEHRKTYNVDINGKRVATELSFPIVKGDWYVSEYEVKIGADRKLQIYITPGDGGGDDGNLIISGVEVAKK